MRTGRNLSVRGVEVTLAEAESRLLPGWDEDIGKRMQKVLEEAEIKVLLNDNLRSYYGQISTLSLYTRSLARSARRIE